MRSPDATPGEAVALYWDFENLHASLIDQKWGQGAYNYNRLRPQETILDVEAVVEYVLSIGPIAINRAFANWISFRHYRHALLQSAVELIQVFPPGANAKNGADIKLCLDAMDDMARFAHIGTIVVVGGDSDYMPLSYKVKATGRNLVGIGARETTNKHWARSCHTFTYYETLKTRETLRPEAGVQEASDAADETQPAAEPARGGTQTEPGMPVPRSAPTDARRPPTPAALSDPDDAGDLDAAPPSTPGGTAKPSVDEWRRLLDEAAQADQARHHARSLLRRALERLAERRGDPWVQKAGLRPFMQRMDPTFHENLCGFDSFSRMLDSFSDMVELRRGEYDQEVRLIDPASVTAPSPAMGPATDPQTPADAPSAPTADIHTPARDDHGSDPGSQAH